MSINDGGQAFPRDDFHQGVPGMSLRDWFAGQALSGLLVTSRETSVSVYVKDAYNIADAMLAERERTS